MAPLPKRKLGKSRQGERRSHLHLEPKELMECPQCRQPMLPHRACPSCGTYDGRVVLDLETKIKKKSEETAETAKAEKPEKSKKTKPEKAEKTAKSDKDKKVKAEKPAKPEKPAKDKKKAE
jgi:large subunit ribosomal protein L32